MSSSERGTRLHNRELSHWVFSGQSQIHGTGLFARVDLKAGQYIGTYHGPEAKRDGTYVLWVYENGFDSPPVGRSGRNLLRYLNHAVPGNAEFDGFDLYARIDIKRGEEITFDYQGAESDQ